MSIVVRAEVGESARLEIPTILSSVAVYLGVKNIQ